MMRPKPTTCVVCGSPDITLGALWYFCNRCECGTLPHADLRLRRYLAGLVAAVMMLVAPAIGQTVVDPLVKPQLSEKMAKTFLEIDWPTYSTFNDSLLVVFSKTRWAGIPTSRGVMKHQLLRFAPDTAGYTQAWTTTTLADTAKDTVVYRFKHGDMGRAMNFYPYRTGDLSILSAGIRKIGVNDSVTMSFIRLPLNLFAFDSAQSFAAGVSSVHADDSLSAALSLLRWGIEAISRTDSAFWTFHERELAMLELLRGKVAVKYFTGSYSDAQVDSIQQSGALVYYMGAKASGRTPLRGYGR